MEHEDRQLLGSKGLVWGNPKKQKGGGQKAHCNVKNNIKVCIQFNNQNINSLQKFVDLSKTQQMEIAEGISSFDQKIEQLLKNVSTYKTKYQKVS